MASHCGGSQQLAVETALVSPLSGQGQPVRRAGRVAGAALAVARRRKEQAYPELVRAYRCRLVVLAVEVGGRWSDEAPPVGHANFVQDYLQQKRAEHQRLIDRIPCVPDLQAAWLLLLFCARPRCLLRALPLAETAAYAAGHDDALAACLSHLLAGVGADGCTVPEGVLQLRRAQLPRCTAASACVRRIASAAHSLPVLWERLPALGADLLAALSAGGGAPKLFGRH